MGSALQSVCHKACGGKEPWTLPLIKASSWGSSVPAEDLFFASLWGRTCQQPHGKSNLHPMPYRHQGHRQSLRGQDPPLHWLGIYGHGSNWLQTLESKLCAWFLPGLLPFAGHPPLKQEFPRQESTRAARQVQALQQPLLPMVLKGIVHITFNFSFCFIIKEVLLC